MYFLHVINNDCQTRLLNVLGQIAMIKGKGKGKSVPLQAWSGPEGSRKLRFPDIVTTAQGGGKVVSLTYRQCIKKINQSRYRSGVAQRVPGS